MTAKFYKIGLVAAAVLAIGFYVLHYSGRGDKADISILISPYQDLAMLVNLKPLGLEKKYGTSVEIVTIPWEDTYPTLLSASKTADMGFASFADYLTKVGNLNRGSNDPLLFVYPAYVFKGGAFVSFKADMPKVGREDLADVKKLRQFLERRLGLPKSTLYQMILYHVAELAGADVDAVRFVDVGFDAGLLAAQAGDLDATAVGLTQLTETQKRGGHVVLDMDSLGFADITGFIVRRSVLEAKRQHVVNLIRMWFDCVDHVFVDIDKNSQVSLAYLEGKAATRYSLESYKIALSQEYFPRSLKELDREILSQSGAYGISEIYKVISGFLVAQKVVAAPPDFPRFVSIVP